MVNVRVHKKHFVREYVFVALFVCRQVTEELFQSPPATL